MVFVCDQYYYYYESSVLTQLLMLNLHNVKLIHSNRYYSYNYIYYNNIYNNYTIYDKLHTI